MTMSLLLIIGLTPSTTLVRLGGRGMCHLYSNKSLVPCSLLTIGSDGHACLIETSESKRRNMPDRTGKSAVVEFASL